jgi:hypothetical protein
VGVLVEEGVPIVHKPGNGVALWLGRCPGVVRLITDAVKGESLVFEKSHKLLTCNPHGTPVGFQEGVEILANLI